MSTDRKSTPDFSILRAALEGLQDGFIIASQKGEIEKNQRTCPAHLQPFECNR